MPQYPRPIRNTRSIESLQRLAQTAADLSFRNDLAEQQQRKMIERRAKAMQLVNDYETDLSGTKPEDIQARDRINRRFSVLFPSQTGFELPSGFLNRERIPTETKEPAKRNLSEREIGVVEKDKKLYRQLVDVDPTQPFDPKNIPAGTPIREEYVRDVEEDKDPFVGKSGLKKSQVLSYIQGLENKNNELNMQIEELDSSIKRNEDGSLEVIQDGKPVTIPATQAKQYSEAIERAKLPAKSGRLNNLLQLVEYKKMLGDRYDNYEKEIQKLRDEISGKRKTEPATDNKNIKKKVLNMPDGSKIEVEIE